jgi:hypothetical protein
LCGLGPLRHEPGPCLFPLENNSKKVISKSFYTEAPALWSIYY